MLKIGIIEDNQELQETYKAYFQHSRKVNCLLMTDTVDSFLQWYREYLQIQVILLDINLPDFSAFDSISMLKKKIPNADIIIQTLNDKKENIIKALRSGANGYLLKNIPLERLESHLLETQKGGSPVSPRIARRIFEYFNPPTAVLQSGAKIELTDREKLIAKMIIEGMPYKKISEQLRITYSGVNYHAKNIFKKLQVHSKGEMTKKYIDGMIEL